MHPDQLRARLHFHLVFIERNLIFSQVMMFYFQDVKLSLVKSQHSVLRTLFSRGANYFVDHHNLVNHGYCSYSLGILAL